MALKLVLGAANSAKAGEVLGAYALAAPRGAILVVPSALDAQHYSRELAEQGTVLGSVVTFSGLIREIAERTSYNDAVLGPIARERLLRRVIQALELSVLRDASRSAGFVRAAGALIAELQRSLLTTARLSQALQAWASEDRRRAPFAQEVGAIYRSYRAELDRIGRVDRELYAWRALDALRRSPGSWGSDPVFFYGFDDMHPLERDAVETLAREVGIEVTVSLTYEPGREALRARAGLVEELRPLAAEVLELPAVDDHYAPRSRGVLHHLERGLFEANTSRVEPGDAVRLLEAGGERAEAELVAAHVLELLRSGHRAEEIVVVYRSPSRAAAVLERVFAQYGVPLALDRHVRLTDTALGRGLIALARMALLGDSRCSADDLLSYLRSPGLLERPEVVDRLEANVRREGLRTAAQARARLGWELQEIDALRTAADPAAELERHGRRLLAKPHRQEESGPILGYAEELDARALKSVLEALADLRDADEPAGGPELVELLEDLEVPAGWPARPGAVLVTDPLAIRARRYRTVFVCGLEEGVFPQSQVPEPFFSDERRLQLALSSGLRLRLSEEALAAERYLFYSCLSRATEQVVLSYRSSDEEGNIALPSPFIADVAELLSEAWAGRRRKRLLADVVWGAEHAPTARERRKSLAVAGAGGVNAPAAQPLLSARALAHVRHTRVLSGGALEKYADCPVKWLIESELQPRRLDPDPQPLTRGGFMHSVLEECIRRLGAPVTPSSLPDALAILDQILAARGEDADAVASGSDVAVRAGVVRSIRADLVRYLEHEAQTGCGWEPCALEKRFGFEAQEGEQGATSLPSLELGQDDAPVRIRGVIDRVDVDPSGKRAIVRDYKSSKHDEFPGNRWRSDRQLQVALYMLAVRELLGLEPVGGFYQPIGGQDLRGRGVYLDDAELGGGLVSGDARDRAGLEDVLRDAAERAVVLARRLRAGDVQPCPTTCSREGCRYPGICRSG